MLYVRDRSLLFSGSVKEIFYCILVHMNGEVIIEAAKRT